VDSPTRLEGGREFMSLRLVPQLFLTYGKTPQERYDIFMNNYNENAPGCWSTVV